ncbi:Glutathione transferase [Bertholletia excelsa]
MAATGVVKVHGPPLSTAVSRVLACLLEKDVQFQLIPITWQKASTRSPISSSCSPSAKYRHLKMKACPSSSHLPLHLREIRKQRTQRSLRHRFPFKSLNRTMARGRRTELQPAKLRSRVPARLRAEHEAEARRRGDKAERGEAREGSVRVREEARREPISLRRPVFAGRSVSPTQRALLGECDEQGRDVYREDECGSVVW